MLIGLFVPIEKRSEILEENLNDFLPLRNKIYHQFHHRGGILDDSNLPELAMYYSKLSFVPPMKRDELNDLYFGQTDNYRFPTPSNNSLPFKNISTKNITTSKMEFHQYLREFKNDILYFEDGRMKNKKNHEFLKELENLSTHYSTLESIWIIHGKNNFTYPYFLFLCLSIMLGIPCVICSDENKLPTMESNHHLIITGLPHLGIEYNVAMNISPCSEQGGMKENNFKLIQVENGNKFIQLDHEILKQLESKLSFKSYKTGEIYSHPNNATVFILLNVQHPYFILFLLLFLKNKMKFYFYNFNEFNETLKNEMEKWKPDLIILPSHFHGMSSRTKYNTSVQSILFSNFLNYFLKKNPLKIFQIAFHPSNVDKRNPSGWINNFTLINPFYHEFLNLEYKVECEIIFEKEKIKMIESSNKKLNILKDKYKFYKSI
jgi:hypothetical protein